MEKIVATLNTTCFDIIYAGVPYFPGEGEEVFAEKFKATLGGGSTATLINLSRLGIPVAIGTFLGKDLYSQMALKQYRELGVEPVNFYRGTGSPVMISTAISTTKDRTFISYQEKAGTIAGEDETYDFLRDAQFVYINNDYPHVNQQLKEDGAILFFDMGFSEDYTLEKMSATLKIADYFTPNLKEALTLTNTKTPQDALKALGEYVSRPMIKLGKKGCLLLEKEEVIFVPEIDEFFCVDSTGAGDAFMAGLIYGVYHDYSLRESVLLGNITGGVAIMGMGCLSEYLTQQELLKKFEKHKAILE